METPLHNAFSAKYVVHTHPPVVGGLVCGKNSQQVCEELFPDFLYMAFTDPGYVLSMRTTEEIIAYREKNGKEPSAIFMENHGVFVAGDTAEEIRDIFSVIMTTLKEKYSAAGIPTSLSAGSEPDQDHVASVVDTVREACGDEHVAYTETSGVFDVAEGPLTPDHIVYMKSFAFMGEPTKEAVASFADEYGFGPRIVKTSTGVVSFGTTENNARLAMELAKDGAVVAKLAEAFGGPRFLSREAWLFIDNWEVESYRRKLAEG